MTRRYTSGFDILGFDTDPTPGDPDLIMSHIVPAYRSIGDDAQAALDALKSNAVQSGSGKTMDALHNLIGTTYPPKLQTAADSFHSAVSIYTAYAQALTEAQDQLDRAMDQATPVAALANTTVQPAPPNATADQVSAVQQQQQSVDQASSQLTAAKRLAQDAQDLRTQAGNTFNADLKDVSAVPDESVFQKFLDFFEHNPVFQIILDVIVAAVAIFFPLIGLALGAAVFTLDTVFNTIANGQFDVGQFVVGLLGLAVGFGAASGAFKAFGGLIKTAAEGAGDAGGGLFSSVAGSAAKGIQSSAKALENLNPIAKTGVDIAKDIGVDSAKDAVSNAIDHEPSNPAEIFGSAAVGAVVGSGFGIAKDKFGKKPKPAAAGASTSAQAPSAAPVTTSAEPLPPSPASGLPKVSLPTGQPAGGGAAPGAVPAASASPAGSASPGASASPGSHAPSAAPDTTSAEPLPGSPVSGPPKVSLPSSSPSGEGTAPAAAPGSNAPSAAPDTTTAGPLPASPVSGPPKVSLPSPQPAPKPESPVTENIFKQGGRLAGGLAGAGTEAGIAQTQGEEETPGEVVTTDAQKLLPDLTNIPAKKK